MSKDITPKGQLGVVRKALAAGTVSKLPMSQRSPVQNGIMKASLKDRGVKGAD